MSDARLWEAFGPPLGITAGMVLIAVGIQEASAPLGFLAGMLYLMGWTYHFIIIRDKHEIAQ